MFLRCSSRKRHGKEHRYFSIVENKRVAGGRVVQRHVLYLGEINSSQELAWRKSIEVFEDGKSNRGRSRCFPQIAVRRGSLMSQSWGAVVGVTDVTVTPVGCMLAGGGVVAGVGA